RSKRRTLREHSRNGWNGCEQFRSAAEARGTSTFQYCGTFAQREELSENTSGTDGMVVSSSGVQQKQDEHRRNSVPVLRNIRSQKRTVRMVVSSSGVQQKQEEHRRSNTAEHSLKEKNSQRTLAERLEWLRAVQECSRSKRNIDVPILRNIRSKRRTLRE